MKKEAAKDLGLSPFRAGDHLQSSEECAAYMEACFAEAPDDSAFIAAARGEVIRANAASSFLPESPSPQNGRVIKL